MRILFIILLTLTAQLSIAQLDWRATTSLEGRFRIYAPAQLVESTDTIETAVGKLVYHTFFHHTNPKSAENVMYMLSYVDYPQGAMHSDSISLLESFFHTTTTTAAEAVKGKLLYVSDTELSGYPGRLWRIDYLEDEAVIRTRAYMVEDRYYALQTVSLRERNLNRSGERFLDSFELLDKQR
ncbi:MAG: hypothetical protein AAGK47_08615 [Bacteroidota bacterium]